MKQLFHRHRWEVVASKFNPPTVASIGNTEGRHAIESAVLMLCGWTIVTQRCTRCGWTEYTRHVGEHGEAK